MTKDIRSALTQLFTPHSLTADNMGLAPYQKSCSVGIGMPVNFPLTSYDEINNIICGKQQDKEFVGQFGPAWRAIAYRFRAADEQANYLRYSLARHGTAPIPEQRYLQEQALYGFFCNAISVFDSAAYGLYAIGSQLAPQQFPFSEKHRRDVTLERTRKAFNDAFSADPIVDAFDVLMQSKEFKSLKGARNVLAHRAAPGRHFHADGGGQTEPTFWKLDDSSLDGEFLSKRQIAVSELLSQFLLSAQRFVSKNFH